MKKYFVLGVMLLLALSASSALAVSYSEFVSGYNAAAAQAKDKSPTATWIKAREYRNGSSRAYEVKFSSVYVTINANTENGAVSGVDLNGKTKNHAAFMRAFNHALAAFMPSFSAADRAAVVSRAKLNDKTFLKEARDGVNGFFNTAEYKGLEIMTAAGAEKGAFGVSFWLK